MSRADQSLTRTTPNTRSEKPSVPTALPSDEPVPTTKPTSVSMSRRRLSPKAGPPSALRCPEGRTMSVPDGTTVPARPW